MVRSRDDERARRFADALANATRSLEQFSRSARQTRRASARGRAGGSSALGGVGSGISLSIGAGIANAAFGAASAVAGIAGRGIGQSLTTGGSTSGAIAQEALNFAKDIPIIGGLAGAAANPLQRGAARTSQITDVIARAGGNISDDFIKQLNTRFVEEEARVERSRERVGADVQNRLPQLARSAAAGNANAEQLVEALISLKETIEGFNPFGGGR